MPGRAGLDLGLSLAYNSLVWTKSGAYVLFDGDSGWPAPGFRLGFPVVQGKFYDSQAQKDTYLLLTPSGSRVSLRQTTTAGVYEAGDSSYLQLTEDADGVLTVRATDGTRMSYRPLGGVYKCAEVKDRQGNFITVDYNSYDNVEAVTDTLGRVINFGYYGDGSLKEITQTWHREVEGSAAVTETHKWAQFYYADKAVRTNFTGLTPFGPASIHALTKVKLADDSAVTFDYTTWGQVDQVAGYAPDGRLLNYVSLDLPADETTARTDCPRPTERRDWAAYWNGDADGATFATRGNLCRTRRWDVTDSLNLSKTVLSEAGYNTLGSALFTSNGAGHKATISYADSDGGTRLAYPTRVTDPGGFYSTAEYNYDTGALTRAVDPRGAGAKTFYDSAGRVLKAESEASGAYTKSEYGASGLYARQYTIVDAGYAETSVTTVFDGAGMVRGTLKELPGSAGGYAGARFTYDVIGRQSGRSNPAEASADASADVGGWQPSGDDTMVNGRTVGSTPPRATTGRGGPGDDY